MTFITKVNIILIITLICSIQNAVHAELSLNSCNYTQLDMQSLRHQTETMFDHAFSSYMTHAFPYDELNPITCKGSNTFGGISLTLIDTLDTLLLFNKPSTFMKAMNYICDNLTFDIDSTVSVFETTIRVLGGLLSSHSLLTTSKVFKEKYFWIDSNYDDCLLWHAVKLTDKLLPAFNTSTKIPFGSIHLLNGVHKNESRVASTAGSGSLLLEFGTLSIYTNNTKYYNVAFESMKSLFSYRSEYTGLVGNHINIDDGLWVATQSGIGALIDSYYEYMIKGYILFGDKRLLTMFIKSYESIVKYIYKSPWFLDAEMYTGYTSNAIQSSLSAYYPGLLVLIGKIDDAIISTRAHYSVWRKYGSLPEGYDVVQKKVVYGRINYPLRPELIEAMFYIHWATNDTAWIGAAANIMHSLEVVSWVNCGFAEIKDVKHLEKGDCMPSFMMSETLKYIYLIFGGGDWVKNGRFVFTTEAHLMIVQLNEFQDLMQHDLNDNDVNDGFSIEDLRKKLKDLINSGEAEHVEAAIEGEELGYSNDDGNICTPTPPPKEEVEEEDEDIVEKLDADLDEEENMTMLGQVKCRRRPKWKTQLTCGYGLSGNDHPHIDVNRLTAEAISSDVEAQVHEFMASKNKQLVVGMIFMGHCTGYRVATIRDHEILFSKLSEDELLAEQKKRKLLSNVHDEIGRRRRRGWSCERRYIGLSFVREVCVF